MTHANQPSMNTTPSRKKPCLFFKGLLVSLALLCLAGCSTPELQGWTNALKQLNAPPPAADYQPEPAVPLKHKSY